MSTEVFVNLDGVVNHRHDGVKGWHDPATVHADQSLHKHQKVEKPTNAAKILTDEIGVAGISLKEQYARAIKGESFQKYWREAKEARVAAGKKVRGPGKAKEEAVEEAEVILGGAMPAEFTA